MSLPLDKKNWPGTQTPTYSDDRKQKPQAPDCDLSSQHQFNDNESAATFGTDSYYEPSFDRWNNVVVNDERDHHRDGTPGMGAYGDRQFASNKADLQSTGEGNNLGLNVIEYGEGAAFNRASTVYIAVDRADRGKSE
jgi:hypothetical protein